MVWVGQMYDEAHNRGHISTLRANGWVIVLHSVHQDASDGAHAGYSLKDGTLDTGYSLMTLS